MHLRRLVSAQNSPKQVQGVPQLLAVNDLKRVNAFYQDLFTKQSLAQERTDLGKVLKQPCGVLGSGSARTGHRRIMSEALQVVEVGSGFQSTNPKPIERVSSMIHSPSNKLVTPIKPIHTRHRSENDAFITELNPLRDASFGMRSTRLSSFDSDIDRLRQIIGSHYKLNGSPPTTTLEMYDIGKRIGKGSFGKVHLATHKLTGLKVAIKTIDKDHIRDERSRRKILQEVLSMRQVISPNVVKFFEMFESSRHLMLVIEYSGGGDLLQLIRTRGRLPESEAKIVFRQAVQAVKDCHSAHIIHRDVKLDNILLSEALDCVKLCDFGVSKPWREGQTLNDQCGTPAYIAPEIIADQGYEGPYVDIWSLGVVLYILLNGSIPFKAKTLLELHKLILRGRVVIPRGVSFEAQDLIRGMLRLVPCQRLSLDAVLAHSWFTSEQEETSVYDALMPQISNPSAPKAVRSKELHMQVLYQMEEMGFPVDSVKASLKANAVNHATATYRLLMSVV